MCSRAIIAVLATFIFVSPAGAESDEPFGYLHEVKLGILDHDTDNLWSGSSRESGVDLNIEAIFTPGFEALNGKIRPVLGASINSAGDTSKVYAGLRWQFEMTNGLFFGVGLGAALHNGDTDPESIDMKALGSRLLFHVPLEAGYRVNEKHSASVYFDHISNGYTKDSNEGLDTLGVRYGYRF